MEKNLSALWNSFTLQHKEQVGKIHVDIFFLETILVICCLQGIVYWGMICYM